MKMALFAIALGLSASAATAGDVAYVDTAGCTHIPVLGSDGTAAYWNLGLEPGCGRTAKEGGWWVDAKRAADEEDEHDK